MLTRIKIPTIDLDKLNFDTDVQMTRKEWRDMVDEHYYQTKDDVSKFMAGEIKNARRSSDKYVDELEELEEQKKRFAKLDEIETDYAVLVELLDLNSNQIEEDYFYEYINTGQPFGLIVDMSEEQLNTDCELEVRMWIDKCLMVWEDKRFTRNDKFSRCPTKEFCITLSDGKTYNLRQCKMFERYNEYKFAMVVTSMDDK